MLWQQTSNYRLFKGAEPTTVVTKLRRFGWTITLRIGEGHIAKYFQGDSFGMADEKHEKITHSVRFRFILQWVSNKFRENLQPPASW